MISSVRASPPLFPILRDLEISPAPVPKPSPLTSSTFSVIDQLDSSLYASQILHTPTSLSFLHLELRQLLLIPALMRHDPAFRMLWQIAEVPIITPYRDNFDQSYIRACCKIRGFGASVIECTIDFVGYLNTLDHKATSTSTSRIHTL